jgi:hypothetical protein
MKDWIPSNKRPHMSWDFKGGKENSRRENDDSLNQSLDDFQYPLIELAQENNRQPKPQGHHYRQQIDTDC